MCILNSITESMKNTKNNALSSVNLNNNSMEYVIYVRKSTDENFRNIPSISQQIQSCIEYAKENGLLLKEKPEDFEFETREDLQLEDKEADRNIRDVYKQSRHLYIVKEKVQATNPGRPKWDLLMEKVRQWEIKWIISYSPDRQARNMSDGWALIDCLDDWLVDLKYANFKFDNSPSWKMMLWMWFVFAKQYHNNLSEAIRRWIAVKKAREIETGMARKNIAKSRGDYRREG